MRRAARLNPQQAQLVATQPGTTRISQKRNKDFTGAIRILIVGRGSIWYVCLVVMTMANVGEEVELFR
jgi:hypothetical protein